MVYATINNSFAIRAADKIVRDATGHPVAARIGTFDAARLAADVAELSRLPFVERPNTDEQGWDGIPLVNHGDSVEGPGSPLAQRPTTGEVTETSALAAAPFIRGVLRAIPGRVVFARLMRMAPGVGIPEHCDSWQAFATGLVRLQLVISGTEGTRLTISGCSLSFEPGDLWYTDVSKPHSVRNDGPALRYNVLVDMELTDESLPYFREAIGDEPYLIAPAPSLSRSQLQKFHCTIDVHPSLRHICGGYGRACIREIDGSLFLAFDSGRTVRLRPQSADCLSVVGGAPGASFVFDRVENTVWVHLRGSDYDTKWGRGGLVDVSVGRLSKKGMESSPGA